MEPRMVTSSLHPVLCSAPSCRSTVTLVFGDTRAGSLKRTAPHRPSLHMGQLTSVFIPRSYNWTKVVDCSHTLGLYGTALLRV